MAIALPVFYNSSVVDDILQPAALSNNKPL